MVKSVLYKSGGKIHIKKSHKGLFTDYCGGNVTSECIQRGKNSSDPKIRKRATFAANARKWKHQQGGTLFQPFINNQDYDVFNSQSDTDELFSYVAQNPVKRNDYPVVSVSPEPFVTKSFTAPEIGWSVTGSQNMKKDNIQVPGAHNENLNYINIKLKEQGIGRIQRAAILANVVGESGGNPNAVGDKGKAKGILQWHPDRYRSATTLDKQISLLIDEINNINSGGWLGNKSWKNKFETGDLRDSVNVFTANFIRPADKEGESNKRYKHAQLIYDQIS